MALADALLFAALALGPLFVAFLFRKRLLRHIFAASVDFAVREYFDDVELDSPPGHKTRVLRPNERCGAFLKRVVPGLTAWAAENVRITMPKFELPAGMDLKQVGMASLAQKVASGKKIKVDDAIPLLLGYGKDWLESSGLLKGKPAQSTEEASKEVRKGVGGL